MVDQSIILVVKKYLAQLQLTGIHATSAVLFGSFATGRGNEDSDIDLIIIAPEFDGVKEIESIKNLWRATVIDSRIEPIPCGKEEWQFNQNRPIIEIARREGIIIAA
jgi:hypothetical protein